MGMAVRVLCPKCNSATEGLHKNPLGRSALRLPLPGVLPQFRLSLRLLVDAIERGPKAGPTGAGRQGSAGRTHSPLGVLRRELVAVLAVRLSGVDTDRALAPAPVLVRGDDFHVARIHAAAVPAKVVNVGAGQTLPSVQAKDSAIVPVSIVERAGPVPATRRRVNGPARVALHLCPIEGQRPATARTMALGRNVSAKRLPAIRARLFHPSNIGGFSLSRWSLSEAA